MILDSAHIDPNIHSASASYTVREAFNDWYGKKKLVARSFEYMKLRVELHILPVFVIFSSKT